jgi:hypothetical protein
MRRRPEFDDLTIDFPVGYADLIEGQAALVELVADWRRKERMVRRNRKALARLALKLRRERREIDGHRRRVARLADGLTQNGGLPPKCTNTQEPLHGT